jgi:gamma-glutamyl phosphate reductase
LLKTFYVKINEAQEFDKHSHSSLVMLVRGIKWLIFIFKKRASCKVAIFTSRWSLSCSVDKLANIDMTKRVIHDAKIDYSATCNTMVFSNFQFTFHVIQCLCLLMCF